MKETTQTIAALNPILWKIAKEGNEISATPLECPLPFKVSIVYIQQLPWLIWQIMKMLQDQFGGDEKNYTSFTYH